MHFLHVKPLTHYMHSATYNLTTYAMPANASMVIVYIKFAATNHDNRSTSHHATAPQCHHARLPPITIPQHHHATMPPCHHARYHQPPRQTTSNNHATAPPCQTTTNHHTKGPQTVQLTSTSTYRILIATHRNTLLVGGDQVSGGNCSGGIVCALHIKCELHRALGTKVWTLTILQEQ